MTLTEIEEALKERLHTRTLKKKDNSSSGCISKGFHYEIDNNENIFVKRNCGRDSLIMFKGELESLKEITLTRTIKCPKPITTIHNYDSNGNSAIVMEYLNITSLNEEVAKKLGYNLANLHDYNNKVIRYNKKASRWIGSKIPSVAMSKKNSDNEDKNDDINEDDEEDEENQFTKHCMKIKDMLISTNKSETSTKQTSESVEYADRFVPEPATEEVLEYGFNVPTSCGSIPQVNDWTKDWVSFYARNRLDKAIREISSDHGDRSLLEEWSKLQLKVDKFFTIDFPQNESKIINSDKIVPALLHGDLWSGNVAQMRLSDEDVDIPVIYDPSSFYGHSEYELGIARMFGGFSRGFEEAYFDVLPKKKNFEKRNKLYQLFHHLNHWSHFGKGYRPSSLNLMKDLNAMV